MKEQYKKLQSKIKKFFKRNSLGKKQWRATHDWLVALSVSVVFVGILTVVGVYAFFFRYENKPQGAGYTSSIKTFDTEKLYELAEQYDAEARLFNTLKTTAPTVPSPGQDTEEVILTEVESDEVSDTATSSTETQE